MKQVAVLFDALRNEQFAVAVKSQNITTYYGPDGQGKEWADWANSTDSKSMPAGVVQGAFKNVEDHEAEEILTGLGYSSQKTDHLSVSKSFKYRSSVKTSNTSKVPAVMDTPLVHFKSSQYHQAVAYKALTLRTNIKESSALFEVRANGYAFNHVKGYFNARPGALEEKTLRQRFEKNLSRSLERRIGLKVLQSLEGDIVRTKIGAVQGLETKSADIEAKGIGQRIGGGSRLARRAGAMATGTFDPKAIDGDEDGLVQEGTAFERPATPKAPKAERGVAQRTVTPATAPKPSSAPPKADEVRERVRPIATSPRERMSVARSERVSSGLASRAERAKTKSKKKAKPGIDKVSDTDGQSWGLLTDDEKKTVVQNLKQRRIDLEARAKKEHSGWWDGFVRANSGIKDPDGNTWNMKSKLQGAALQDFDTEIGDLIDEMNAVPVPTSADPQKYDEARKLKIEKLRRLQDDLRTLNNMEAKDDFSLIEHLHAGSRKAAIGKVAKTQMPNYTPVSFTKGRDTGSLNTNDDSSIFGRTGGATVSDLEKPIIGEKRDKKLAAWVRRLSEPNPARVRRREIRKARKTGGARTAEQARPVEQAKARIRRAKRSIQARIRGDESPADVLKRSGRTTAEGSHPLDIKASTDGNPLNATYKVTDNFIERMGAIANEVGTLETGEKKTSRKADDKNLLNLWENMEFNALPTAVSEDVFERLVGAGWVPHNRGVGNDPGFAEAYISEPDRFIPGRGGRVHGVGEYWAPPKSGHAWGYGDSQVIGFINPNARAVEKSELNTSLAKGKQIRDIIKAYDAGFPTGEGQKTDPADYIENLMADIFKSIPADSDIWDSPMGQIYKQLLASYKGSGKDEKKRLYTWAALKHINSMYDHGDWGYFAPMLGIDAVLDGGAVSLVHNRGAMVVLDRGTTVAEGKKIVNNGYALRTPKAA